MSLGLLEKGVCYDQHVLLTKLLASALLHFGASQVALVVKKLPVSAGDVKEAGLISGWGRSSGGGHGNPLQCSCVEHPDG